jgi:peptidoglycan/LPS O-acetylase OafA/YrhL
MAERVGFLPIANTRIYAIFGYPLTRTMSFRTGYQLALVHCPHIENKTMSLGTILLVVLILMLVGALPSWPHSRSWGYFPSGLLGLVVVILLVMLLTGRI